MLESNKAVTRFARISLAASAIAAMVACGGGEADDKAAPESRKIDGVCLANPSAISDASVVPNLCNAYETDTPTFSCEQFFPGSKEILATKADGGAVWSRDGTTSESLAALPGWLSVTEAGVDDVTPWSFEWTSTDTAATDYQVVGVLIKNGSQTHIYDYVNSAGGVVPSDTNLEPPSTTRASFWYNVCYVEKPIVVGDPQWCSPGYWKNHPDAWPAGTASMAYTGATTWSATRRNCDGLPAAPTLQQVINNPQCYGGETTNLVADYLSDVHPGVNYSGVRVENCPLN